MTIPINNSNSNNLLNELFNKQIHLPYSFSNKKKEMFYKELNILLNANVDIEQSLDIITNLFNNPKDASLIKTIKNSLIKGSSLHEALQNTNHFNNYECFSIKIGEESNNLQNVLLELHLFYERKIKMKRQIISVITYPIFVFIITIAVLYFMLNNVVPMFSNVFIQFGEKLPPITQNIINLSKLLPFLTILFLTTIIVMTGIHLTQKNKEYYRKYLSTFFLKIPYIGNLIQTIYLARFCQSLKLLLAAKTPLMISLELVQKMISYYPIEISLEFIKKDIYKGESFGNSLKKHPIYHHKLTSMVSVGEQINELDKMFEKLTTQLNDELDYKTKMISVILEPLIILLIGTIVGVIMVAMYAPMFNLSKIITP